ncbi:MAG TPA: hypothetical protein VGB30_05700 [bacterium]
MLLIYIIGIAILTVTGAGLVEVAIEMFRKREAGLVMFDDQVCTDFSSWFERVPD